MHDIKIRCGRFFMNSDSINLLKECNSGCKNATDSMEQVLSFVKDEKLKKIIEDYDDKHIKIGDECHKILNKEGESEEDPNKITMAMAWFGTEVKLMINDGSDKIAELMVDGCNMGIKSLSKYNNKYRNAESKIKDLVFELISVEQDFMNELLAFL